MKISGSVAIVTGGAEGIGESIADQLLTNGAKVCIGDINRSLGEETAKRLGKQHGEENIAFVHCDVTKEDNLQDLYNKTKATFGKIDIVANNAGVACEKNWTYMLKVNLEAVIRSTNIAITHMGKRGGGYGGLIVNTASFGGVIPFGFYPTYAATKHGVVGFVRSMADSKYYEAEGIRFNAVVPPLVMTKMNSIDYIAENAINQEANDMTMSALEEIKKDIENNASPKQIAEAFVKIVKSDLNGAIVLVRNCGAYTIEAPKIDLGTPATSYTVNSHKLE